MEKKKPEAVTPAQDAAIEDHCAPEIYASLLLGCDIEAGVVKLTFLSNRRLGDKNYQAVCLRLAMPAVSADNMAQFVTTFLNGIKASAAPAPTGGKPH